MLCEPVGGDRIGILRVSNSVFGIVRPAPVLHDRIDGCFGIKQIRDRRFYRFIERGQRAIGQSTGGIEPAATFNVHREWIRASMGIQSCTIWVSFGSW